MEHGVTLFGVEPEQLLDRKDLHRLLEENTDEVWLIPECEHSPREPHRPPISRADPRRSNVILT